MDTLGIIMKYIILLNPHIVYKVDLETGLRNFVETKSEISNLPKLRGGSKIILTKYGYLGIAHNCSLKTLLDNLNFTRIYSHYFYLFNSEYPFQLLKVSEPFTLSKKIMNLLWIFI